MGGLGGGGAADAAGASRRLRRRPRRHGLLISRRRFFCGRARQRLSSARQTRGNVAHWYPCAEIQLILDSLRWRYLPLKKTPNVGMFGEVRKKGRSRIFDGARPRAT